MLKGNIWLTCCFQQQFNCFLFCCWRASAGAFSCLLGVCCVLLEKGDAGQSNLVLCILIHCYSFHCSISKRSKRYYSIATLPAISVRPNHQYALAPVPRQEGGFSGWSS